MFFTLSSNFKKLLNDFEISLGLRSELKWKTVLSLTSFHIFGFCWCYLYAVPAKWQTVVFAMFMFVNSGLGFTCGVHRLWTHRCFKATLPLRIYLMLCFASGGQNSVYDWVRDHRVHHKFSDTEADPHNVNRGFFFSHIGWLMMKKNNLVLEKGRQIDMSDIESDPVLIFERKYTTRLSIVFCYILPTLTGIFLCDEKWQCTVAWQCFIRVLVLFHGEMTVNSFAHMFGSKPYKKDISPTQNLFVTTVAFGEGCHNYHHMFPNDYKSSETLDFFNLSTMNIKIWEKLGLVYDLKEPTPELIQAVAKREGDGTYKTRIDNKIKVSETEIESTALEKSF